eukprot:684745-Amphidinium_carterae.1
MYLKLYFLGSYSTLASQSTGTWFTRWHDGLPETLGSTMRRFAALVKWFWLTSNQSQSTSWTFATRRRRQKAFGWERQPTV